VEALDADPWGRSSGIVELGSGVDAKANGEVAEQGEQHRDPEDEDQATHVVTTLSLAPVWYSELGQVEMYLD
jgi:hypothetical protein